MTDSNASLKTVPHQLNLVLHVESLLVDEPIIRFEMNIMLSNAGHRKNALAQVNDVFGIRNRLHNIKIVAQRLAVHSQWHHN